MCVNSSYTELFAADFDLEAFQQRRQRIVVVPGSVFAPTLVVIAIPKSSHSLLLNNNITSHWTWSLIEGCVWTNQESHM